MQKIKRLIYSVLIFIFLAQTSHSYADPFTPPTEKPIRILVIEGGGVHGLLSATMLKTIEEKSGEPISKLFDVMVGTSTGAIQVVLLNTPKPNTHEPLYSATEIVDFYLTSAQAILNPPLSRRLWTLNGLIAPLITQDELFHYAQEKLGNTTLNDSLTSILIPAYDLNTGALFLFKSADPAQKNYLFSHIALASTAIPNIMPAYEWSFNDGKHYLTDATVIANNPSLDALLYASQLYPNRPKILVFLGSGKPSLPKDPLALGQKGLMGFPNNWIQMLYHGSDRTLQGIMKLEAKNHLLNLEYYFYLNPDLPDNIGSPIDASDKNVALLKKAADDYGKKHDRIITKMVSILKNDQSHE